MPCTSYLYYWYFYPTGKTKEGIYLKLGDYVAYWYKTYKMPKHAKSTSEVQWTYINLHIKPSTLGMKDLKEVYTGDIQKFLGELLMSGNKSKLKSLKSIGEPLSFWTVQKIRQLLISAYKQALKENIIDHNFAADTDPIPKPIKHNIVFSPEHQQKFLHATKNHRFYVAYVLLFYIGCRRSELLALSWNNINFKQNTITICQGLVIENNVPTLKKTTKTQKSVRTIPIPQEIKFLLRNHQRNQTIERNSTPNWNNPEDLVFVNKDGSYHNPRYFSRNFKETLKRLGLPPNLHVHSTRHTFATNLLQLSVPIVDVQALGGWSTPNVLLNIYAHTVQKSHKKAINKLYKYI